MPIDPSKLCKCHGEPMFRATGGKRAPFFVCKRKWRARQLRYYKKARVTVGGRETQRVFFSAKHATAMRLMRDQRRREFAERQRKERNAAL